MDPRGEMGLWAEVVRVGWASGKMNGEQNGASLSTWDPVFDEKSAISSRIPRSRILRSRVHSLKMRAVAAAGGEA
jgi:hypothetical protein